MGARVRLVDECAHPRVRANIDVSHLVLADCGPEEVRKLRGRAVHVHLTDCWRWLACGVDAAPPRR